VLVREDGVPVIVHLARRKRQRGVITRDFQALKTKAVADLGADAVAWWWVEKQMSSLPLSYGFSHRRRHRRARVCFRPPGPGHGPASQFCTGSASVFFPVRGRGSRRGRGPTGLGEAAPAPRKALGRSGADDAERSCGFVGSLKFQVPAGEAASPALFVLVAAEVLGERSLGGAPSPSGMRCTVRR